MHSTVQGRVAMELLLQDMSALPVTVDLDYDSRDPLAVRCTFRSSETASATWVFARQLLCDGLEGPAGEGDVCILPLPFPLEPEQGPEVCIVLRSPHGEAQLFAPAHPLAGFLARTHQISPIGREPVGDSLESQLAAILEQGSRKNS
ncbi:SsgA family sporulation/cell division regulator [Kitasatospora sp. NPDC057015]|uniref:SsgA family sporulation/cell division regulator n=1 Tax=Kitasatospora sp. NPDC057015 TaxID=3346001 RepID=UPI00363CC75D